MNHNDYYCLIDSLKRGGLCGGKEILFMRNKKEDVDVEKLARVLLTK